jgi:hypothetical protein
VHGDGADGQGQRLVGGHKAIVDGVGRETTNVPRPGTLRTIRSRAKTSTACLTVPTARPVAAVSWVSDGNRDVISPAMICFRSRSASCRLE